MSPKINSGITLVVPIILVALSFIGLATLFILAGQLKNVEEETSFHNRTARETEDKMREVEFVWVKVSPLVMTVEPNEKITIEKHIGKYLDEKKKSYTLMGKGLTLENIAYEALDKLFTSDYKLARVSYEKKTSEKQEVTLRLFQREIEEKYNSYITELKQQKEEALLKKSKENEKYLLLKEQLNTEKRKQEEKLPVLQEKYKKEITALENIISITRYSLEELASKEAYSRDVIESYGKIFNPDIKNRFAFITLGSKDSVRVGLKFMAYRQQQGFVRNWKGQVEVKRVYDAYSLVSITKIENKDDPITDGDFITNIFYHPLHPRRVVLVGKFKRGSFRYDKDEIEQRLTDIGVIVEKNPQGSYDVSLRTDFALIGDDPEDFVRDKENLDWTRKLNIPRIEDEEARKSLEYYLGD
ncbi:MAG: hypothetical protein QME51_03675 [Planctomycetota bacterium]|nr:hypothetical protein [Planctomycetota bacterium]